METCEDCREHLIMNFQKIGVIPEKSMLESSVCTVTILRNWVQNPVKSTYWGRSFSRRKKADLVKVLFKMSVPMMRIMHIQHCN